MWLINTQTLQLEEFLEVPVNPSSKTGNYAILSHTWDNDEVLFRDMTDLSSARLKKGWTKIEQTCRLAREQGLPYAWVDTCCINKSDPTELGEAINSMYRWYELSDVCFVWLADLVVPSGSFLATPEMLEIMQTEALAKCRWFTRGWTLQELVAPADIEFFDSSWKCIGNKSALEAELSSITGIDVEVLRNPAKRVHVAVGKRMSWAASRRTTRTEDIAYCLLGIFNVNMHLMYGEGKKAFIRLQEQILMVASTDLSLFAWKADSIDDDYSHGMLAAGPHLFKVCKNMTQPRFPTSVQMLLVGNGLEVRGPAYKEGEGEDDDYKELDLNMLECGENTQFKPLWVTVGLTRGTRKEFYRAYPRHLEYHTIRSWLYSTHKPTAKTLSLLKFGSFWDAGHVGKGQFMSSNNNLVFDDSMKQLLYLPPGARLPQSTELKFFRCQFRIYVSVTGVRQDVSPSHFRPVAVRIGASYEPKHLVILLGFLRSECPRDSDRNRMELWIRLIDVCPGKAPDYHLAKTSILTSGANLWSKEVREAQYAVTRDYLLQHWTGTLDRFASLVPIEQHETASPPLDFMDEKEFVTHRFTATASRKVSEEHDITLSYQRIEHMDY